MKESGSRTSLVVPLLAAGLLIAAFGAGLIFGRSSPQRRPPAAAKPAESVADPRVTEELSACRQAIAARAKGLAAPPTTAAPPEQMKKGEPETAAKIEALEEDLHKCKKGELLTHAYDCYSIDRQFTLMLMLASVDETSCEEKAKIGRSIAANFEKCAGFKDALEKWDPTELTEEEQKSVVNAVNVQRTDDKEKIKAHIESIINACQKTIRANRE
jgi:hypothetical protein